MTGAIRRSLVVVSLGIGALALGLAGCQSAPVETASEGAQATYHAASTGAHAVYETGSDVYSGIGSAAKKPFQDFNMLQDPIAPVLLRAEAEPYGATGLISCEAILNEVAELDLALGPDVDTPKDRRHKRVDEGASLAAGAALDAASSAAEGFLPMRSVVKHITGASRYEEHVRRARLAGSVRRAFLKAIGMDRNCAWPAAPLGFRPTLVATRAALGPPIIRTAALPLPPIPSGAAPLLVAAAQTSPARAVGPRAAPSPAPAAPSHAPLAETAFVSSGNAPWASSTAAGPAPKP